MAARIESNVDRAGRYVAELAMKIVARHPRMTVDQIDAVIAAMKAAAAEVTDMLLRPDVRVEDAVATLAQRGIAALR